MGKTICAYCRVSTNKDDQVNSLENQRTYFEREITSRGHQLYEIYADEGLTGTKLDNRPNFNRMLSDAGIDANQVTIRTDRRIKKETIYVVSDRTPAFEEIWVKNTSRFARNTLSFDIINKLRQKKVNVFFIEQNINTGDVGQDVLLKLIQVFDESDSKDKSSKVRWGNAESAKKGRIRSHPKLFGFNYDRVNNRLTVRPEEAETIRFIFEEYSKGIGIRRLIHELDEKGIKTRKGESFGRTTIRHILDNEKYCGLNNPLKYETGTVLVDKHWPRVKGSYDVAKTEKIEPIISQELFYKCRAQIECKNGNSKGIYTGLSRYAGRIYCGLCGRPYYADVDRGRRFYKCSGKKDYRLPQKCPSVNVSEKKLDEAIYNYLTAGAFQFYCKTEILVAISWVIVHLQNLIVEIKSDASTEIERLKREIAESKTKLGKLYDLYASYNEKEDVLKEKIDQEIKNRQSLEAQWNNLTRPLAEKIAEKDLAVRAYQSLKNLRIPEVPIDISPDSALQYVNKITIWTELHKESKKKSPFIDISTSIKGIICGLIGDEWLDRSEDHLHDINGLPLSKVQSEILSKLQSDQKYESFDIMVEEASKINMEL